MYPRAQVLSCVLAHLLVSMCIFPLALLADSISKPVILHLVQVDHLEFLVVHEEFHKILTNLSSLTGGQYCTISTSYS